jgi:RNA polymerase sigma-70 factor (ECF subfamily)
MDGTRQDALVAIYRDHFPALVRYLETLLGERAAAEDAAQDAGMRFLAAGQAQALREPRAFLYHVATNLARDQLRRRVTRQRAERELLEAHAETQGSDAVAAAREELERVQRALEAMPPRPRQVIRLARIEGYSHREIAEQLGISPKTVENHLTRGLAMLARSLRPVEAADALGGEEPGNVP